MKVKIVKAGLDTYWYADRIGEVYDVLPEKDTFGYPVIGKPLSVKPEDCVVLPNYKNCSGDVTEYMIRNVLTKEQLTDLCVWALKEIDNVRSD